MMIKNYNYDLIAEEYAKFNYKHSQSAIIHSKLVQLNEISANKRILFTGSGPGEDSLAAAEKGADVTCIDISERMLAICAEKFKERKLVCRFINANIMEHLETYDIVIANYFLNIFNRKSAQTVLTHLSTLLAPAGVLMIADVSPLKGNLFYRAITYFSYLSVAGPAALAGLTALHVPYEYNHFFKPAGLKLKWEKSFRQLKMGPPLYKTWAAIKAVPQPQ